MAITPLFRWAGSKRKQLPVLEQYWRDDYKRYVEPFAGSAALFFRIQPKRALLGDINEALVEAYEVIRENADEVYHKVRAIPRSERRYYKVRSMDPRRMSRFNRTVRFVYLNRYCFNGIYRTNTNGDFNVPYAHVKPGVIPPISDFRKCARMLCNATVRCSDFGSVLSEVRQGDFVYLDPPYVVNSRRVFRQYDKRSFTTSDLERLGRHLERMDAKGAAFVLSYADCQEARAIFSQWNTRRLRVRRHIAGFADARRSAFELLVTNFDREDDRC